MPSVIDSTGTERQLRSVEWFNRSRAAYAANHRNHVRLHPFLAGLAAFEAKMSLRSLFPPAYDQLQIGSCTGNGIAGCEQYQMKRQGFTDWTPSRLQIYQQELDDQGDPQHTDEGATITESVQEGMQHGFAKEADYPYDTSKLPQPIPASIKALALKNRITGAHPIAQDLNTIKAEIAAGNSINVGFLVHQGYENVGADGRVPAPTGPVLGGHDNVIIGTNDDMVNLDGSKGACEMRNSWGVAWADQGNCWQPYSTIVNPNEFSDFQAVTAVAIGDTPTPPTPTPPPAPVSVALGMNVQPQSVIVGIQAPAFSVKVVKVDGTLNDQDNATIVVCTLPNYNNTQSVKAEAGIATFKGDTFAAVHTQIHYHFSALGLPGVDSAPFDVNGSPTTKTYAQGRADMKAQAIAAVGALT